MTSGGGASRTLWPGGRGDSLAPGGLGGPSLGGEEAGLARASGNLCPPGASLSGSPPSYLALRSSRRLPLLGKSYYWRANPMASCCKSI